MSGETTTVRPARTSAGNWKQSDLPPPVGSTANTSLPAERVADDFLLQRAERTEAEKLFQRREQMFAAKLHGRMIKNRAASGRTNCASYCRNRTQRAQEFKGRGPETGRLLAANTRRYPQL